MKSLNSTLFVVVYAWCMHINHNMEKRVYSILLIFFSFSFLGVWLWLGYLMFYILLYMFYFFFSKKLKITSMIIHRKQNSVLLIFFKKLLFKKKKKNTRQWLNVKKLGELGSYTQEVHERSTDLQFSMVFGRNSIWLPETFKTLSLERQPIEFGSDLSWFECTSKTTIFSNLAIKDSGMLCQIHNQTIIYYHIQVYVMKIQHNNIWSIHLLQKSNTCLVVYTSQYPQRKMINFTWI